MGFELARAFSEAGASVTLITGPVRHETPRGVACRHDVETAAEMAACVENVWNHTDVLIMTAAVADMSPRHVSDHKLKKQSGFNAIEVQPTIDILASTAQWPKRQDKVVVGFAAETEALEEQASQKLERKCLDAIVANNVGLAGIGFGPGDNAGLLLLKDQRHEIKRASKARFSERLVTLLIPRILERLRG